MLSAIGLHQLNTGDLCNRVPLVCRLKRPGRLASLRASAAAPSAGINAGGAEERVFLPRSAIGGLDKIESNGEGNCRPETNWIGIVWPAIPPTLAGRRDEATFGQRFLDPSLGLSAWRVRSRDGLDLAVEQSDTLPR